MDTEIVAPDENMTDTDIKEEKLLHDDQTGVQEKDEILEKEARNEQEEKEKDTRNESGDELEDGWLDILGSGSIMKKVLQKGKGENTRPMKEDLVMIHMKGQLEDGTTVDVFEELQLTVGEHTIPAGVDLSLLHMEVSEVCMLKVDSRFAYGSKGREPDIPPEAKITYEVELVKVDEPLNFDILEVSEKLSLGNSKRERANFLYDRGEYHDSVVLYEKTLAILAATPEKNLEEIPEEHHQLVVDLKIKCFNNMAAAQLKLENYGESIRSCDNVLAVEPSNVKALFRKGKVLGAQGNLKSAINVLRRAQELDSSSKLIQAELTKIVKRQKRDIEREKAMYKRMLGTDKENSDTNGAPKGYGKVGLMAVVGAAAATVLSIVAYKYMHTVS